MVHALRDFLFDLHESGNLVDYVGFALLVVTRSKGVQHLRWDLLFVHLVAESAQKVIRGRKILHPSARLHLFLRLIRSRRLCLYEQVALIIVTKYIKLTLKRRQLLLLRPLLDLRRDIPQGDVILEVQATIYHRISIFHAFVDIFEF